MSVFKKNKSHNYIRNQTTHNNSVVHMKVSKFNVCLELQISVKSGRKPLLKGEATLEKKCNPC